MSQKPDYYAILGVEKTATEADIKKAFMRITMTCHPDGAPYKKLDDAKKAEADEKFKYGKEAVAVLTDAVKRTAYDKFGHAGLDSMKGQPGSEQSASSPSTPRPVRTRSNEEVFDYFDRAAERNGDRSKQSAATSGGDDLSEEDMRRAAAEARRRNRGQNSDNSTFAPPPAPREEPKPAPQKPAEKPAPVSSPVSAIFDSVASKMSDAADRLRTAAKTDAPVSVDALEKFRESLSDLIGEVDDAIRTARRNPPRGGYNR